MKEAILKIIEEESAKKREKGLFPVVVLDVELHKAIKKKTLESLRELWKEGKIDTGRTINHNFVEIRKPDSPRRNRKIVLHQIT